jgi:SAM-dependent methyltransferase
MRSEQQVPDRIQKLLYSLGICDERSIEVFYPETSDRQDIQVLRCRRSGVIFLSRSDHITDEYYEVAKGFGGGSIADTQMSSRFGCADTERRTRTCRDFVINSRWVDVGSGAGAILKGLAPFALETAAVEPQMLARAELERSGWTVYPDVSRLPEAHFDCATLFQVFEHFVQPLSALRILRTKLADGGRILLEVPHARDFLITFFQLEAFRRFVFTSEHLILHTRDSLRILLEEAGFSEIVISGIQRYPLANHLHWLAGMGRRGHLRWGQLRTPELDIAYEGMLASLDMTDTLIATAVNTGKQKGN